MLNRLLAVAIAAATLLLTGCQTTPEKFLPPDKRDKTPFLCPDPLCYVQVDPSKPQWVPEYIRPNRGGVVHLWLAEGVAYVEPPITFKTSAAASALDCSEHALRIVRCKLRDSAQAGVEYGYTIHVKDKPDYDPFIWPQ